MTKKDVKFKISKKLWELAKKKLKSDFPHLFPKKCKDTDAVMMLLLLLLANQEKIYADTIFLFSELGIDPESERVYKSISVHTALLDEVKETLNHPSYTLVLEMAVLSYLWMDINNYLNRISPLYTIVGYKNIQMQKETAEAIKDMKLDASKITLVDGCCATGSLFFGTYMQPWKQVILNDKNPLRTNFLNVLLNKPLELINAILSEDFSAFETADTKNKKLHGYQAVTKTFLGTHEEHYKVRCDATVAAFTFLQQCIDKAYIEKPTQIFHRLANFLPANLKMVLNNVVITQKDCRKYLKNDDNDKLVLLDVPYIGSETECCVKGMDYGKFHREVFEFLEKADYPFLYYCRSTPPKSDNRYNSEDAADIMKKKLGVYLYDKGYFFERVELATDVELMVCNRLYDSDTQVQWNTNTTSILFAPSSKPAKTTKDSEK